MYIDNRLAASVINQALECLPGLDQRHSAIIDHLTVLVPRVLLVAGLEGEGCMDEVAIDMIDLQSPAARVKGGLDPLRAMIGVP